MFSSPNGSVAIVDYKKQERIQAILDESNGMWKPHYGENYYQIDAGGFKNSF